MQHNRVFKSILIGLCLILLVGGGLVAIVGSGGGDSRTPQGAMQTFLSGNIACGGRSFVQVTIGGQVMNTSRGNLSGCVFLPPGTYNANVRLSAPGCPTLIYNISMNITDRCTTRLNMLRINPGNVLVFSRGQACPGNCNPKLDGEAEDLIEEAVELDSIEGGGSDWI